MQGSARARRAILVKWRSRPKTRQEVSYNSGISACEKGEQWQRALALLSEMWEAKAKPDAILECQGVNRRCAGAAAVPSSPLCVQRKDEMQDNCFCLFRLSFRLFRLLSLSGADTRAFNKAGAAETEQEQLDMQEDVFDATLAPLVDEVLAGYEATAFAYGQTGTGKTYTMEGDLETDEGRGLVPRTAAAVIGALASEIYTEYSITCSYLEIYNEELSDLLAPVNQPAAKLDLKDVPGKGVCCMGLSEVPVESVDEILALVHRAQERRRVAETRVNARSSRSHCLFTMRVRCRRTVNGGEMENSGKLHLVDLAGSECAKTASGTADAAAGKAPPATPRGGETERERKNINQSLLTLGRVITALRDGSGRVPYRDSKLTRLLQDALGGRCKEGAFLRPAAAAAGLSACRRLLPLACALSSVGRTRPSEWG
ncbi:unnamed protein product [Prorocentrum cordatum]|uniref:Kinesin-like protein n=1 Tax=Prorocentrum cordatum TaxID=2364126 RepID=A0ABN9TX81_9DINO|nr:unnamed protein product [Polarella glacialis]